MRHAINVRAQYDYCYIGNLSAADPDAGDTDTYTLLDNAGGRFAISGTELKVADGSLLDFESAVMV